jgi:hypothetical protein
MSSEVVQGLVHGIWRARMRKRPELSLLRTRGPYETPLAMLILKR